METDVPLCVDLDGTLIRTDLLIESILLLVRINPLYLLFLPIWLFKGKGYLKGQIARRVCLDPKLLPYNKCLLDYLRSNKTYGRRLILATASTEKFARQIADYLKLFSEVIASNENFNASGYKKLECLKAVLGEKGFDYVGNSKADLKIWPHSRKAILVNPEFRVKEAVKKIGNLERVFEEGQRGPWKIILAMRPYQWLKNILVFVPLAVGHQLDNVHLLFNAIIAFIAFSLCASIGYLINDLLDLTADRNHVSKKNRPFASGEASLKLGLIFIFVLPVVVFSLVLLLPALYSVLMTSYFVMTFVYSFWLKKIPILDVLVLASLYTLRICAGGAAVSIMPSFWLLAFSVFHFLSLATIKRYVEIHGLMRLNQHIVIGRGYKTTDLETMRSFGVSSGYIAILVLALYINSEDIGKLYSLPEAIWFLCPLFLYWISRMWLIAGRGEMHDDPVVFAITDKISQITGLLAFLIILIATIF